MIEFTLAILLFILVNVGWIVGQLVSSDIARTRRHRRWEKERRQG